MKTSNPTFKGYFAYTENINKPLKLGKLVEKSFSADISEQENVCLIKVAPVDDEFVMDIFTQNPNTKLISYEQEKPHTKATWDDRVSYLIEKFFDFGQL